ncbi:MAG TPA: hypothetical protein PLJ27_07475 [Polyangiaceae bacterium]|nr:MAG: hypothetical protein BWY17_00474 [Deltaproteobacteria bacterium ADurb.Bin207]HNS99502.1 hypothetical protein [Polyangiaceae bacterium]HNZ20898.1 hypothetical protein [Polyangiaceae bacterium]HOD21471.1 hypothetical protein [Polyangiaceae bacterium]HOE47579.1 hypothetical protein [Polyangiaceae bacterium]
MILRQLIQVSIIAVGALGCGYRSTLPSAAPSHWCVQTHLAPALYPQASAALVFGVREALAQRGWLANCSNARVLRVQVLDVRFETEGLIAQSSAASARAMRVVVSAAADIDRSPADRELMVTESYEVASMDSPLAQEQANDIGVVTAARQAGHRLVQKLAHEPSVGTSSP